MVQVIYNNDPEIPMSTYYKLLWFVSRVSSASPHLLYSQRHWLVSFQPFLCSPLDHGSRLCLPSHTLSLRLLAFKFQYLLTLLSPNMYSYKTLAIIVLALSTAFPAFSAPIGYGLYVSTPKEGVF